MPTNHDYEEDHVLCGQAYSEKYDAYYCLEHNVWTEGSCNSDTCQFCASRPATPLPGQVPHGRVRGTDV